MSKDHDGDQKRKDDYKDKSVLYIPPKNYNVGLKISKIEKMFAKVVKGVNKM